MDQTKPGVSGESFKITLSSDMVNEFPGIMDTTYLEVVSEPIKHRYQWYWKILYYLTFGIFFWEYYTYECKLKQDNK